jgi:hypothetical protein
MWPLTPTDFHFCSPTPPSPHHHHDHHHQDHHDYRHHHHHNRDYHDHQHQHRHYFLFTLLYLLPASPSLYNHLSTCCDL